MDNFENILWLRNRRTLAIFDIAHIGLILYDIRARRIHLVWQVLDISKPEPLPVFL